MTLTAPVAKTDDIVSSSQKCYFECGTEGEITVHYKGVNMDVRACRKCIRKRWPKELRQYDVDRFFLKEKNRIDPDGFVRIERP